MGHVTKLPNDASMNSSETTSPPESPSHPESSNSDDLANLLQKKIEKDAKTDSLPGC